MSMKLFGVFLLVPALGTTGVVLAQDVEEKQAEYIEVQQARTQMEDARRQLEEAARTIAEVQLLPNANPDFNRSYSFLTSLAGDGAARIGAVIVNAPNGALVTQVAAGQGAAEAGVEIGDVIQSIDGIDITAGDEPSADRFMAQLREIEQGDTVSLVVERAGDTLPFDVETAAGPGWVSYAGPGSDTIRIFSQAGAPAQSLNVERLANLGKEVRWTLGFARAPWGDMELVTISEGLGRYFETSEGLLVVSGPGDEAIDIRDGDVILAISGRTPNSPEHAIRILSSFEGGETVEFSIMRDGRRETVEYVLPEGSTRGPNVLWNGEDRIVTPVPAPD